MMMSTLIAMTGWVKGQGEAVRVIVRFHGEADAALVAARGGSVVGNLTGGALVARVPAAALAGLAGDPSVVRVEEDAVASITGQVLPWGVERIGAHRVWSTTRDTGVRVAVVDTGIDSRHKDFFDAAGVTRVERGANFVSGSAPEDDHGHGTHVAGTVGASDNLIGVVGVAPAARLVAVKVMDRTGSGYYSWIISGIDWASDPARGRSQVINLSLGGSANVLELRDAVARATQRGAVVCAAMGNTGGYAVLYPAAYPEAVAVAASTQTDGRAGFSSYGPHVDISAPGENIYSTYPWKKGRYATMSGTSMATPHVSGAAATLIGSGLIVDRNGDGRINDEVRARLEATAVDTNAALWPGYDQLMGWGRLDLAAAVAAGAN
jgi:subtilisin